MSFITGKSDKNDPDTQLRRHLEKSKAEKSNRDAFTKEKKERRISERKMIVNDLTLA